MTIDARIAAAYSQAFDRRSVMVTISALVGVAPNVVETSAQVRAVIQLELPDSGSASRSGYGEREQGGITQADREVIVLVADLMAQNYPMPVRKGHKVTLPSTGERLNIVDVDAETRQLAGAIVLKAAGVE